jgi:hypothetical protein
MVVVMVAVLFLACRRTSNNSNISENKSEDASEMPVFCRSQATAYREKQCKALKTHQKALYISQFHTSVSDIALCMG